MKNFAMIVVGIILLMFSIICNATELVSWWELEENVSDYMGNNDGTLYGDPTYTNDTPGGESLFGLNLDGTGDYIGCGTNDSLDLPDGDFTIESWVKPSNTSLEAIAGKNLFTYNAWGLYQLGRFYFQFRGTGSASLCQADSIYTIGNWYHVAATKDGNILRLYINGVLQQDVETTTESPSTSSYSFDIGTTGWSSNYNFEGKVDDVRVWDVALTENEIAWVLDHPGEIKELVSWWKLEENVGDYMGNNDGTLYGDPTYTNDTPGGESSFGLNLDGTGDYIGCGTDESLDLSDGDFTIEAWVKPSDTSLEAIAGKHLFTYNAWGIYQSGRFYFQFRGTGTTALCQADSIYTIGNWYHVAATKDGNILRLYVNGVLQQDVETTTESPSTFSYSFNIGTVGWSDNYNFEGKIDDVRVWETALTGNEIAWNADHPGEVKPFGSLGGSSTVNLITDASFESAIPLKIDRGDDFFIDKLAVWDDRNSVSAHEGLQVLNYRCWDSDPHTFTIKQPFEIDTESENISLSLWLRTRVATTGSVNVEVSLYDATEENILTFLVTEVDTGSNTWINVCATDLYVPSGSRGTDVKLGFKVTGPSDGYEIDIDQVGVFTGASIPVSGIADNSDFHFIEAEDLANDTSWDEVTCAGANNPASGPHSTLKVLGGYAACANAADAIWELEVDNPGTYNLWCRLYSHTIYSGTFTLDVYQNNQLVGSKEIDDSSYGSSTHLYYVWDNLEVDLDAGDVEVHISRSDAASSALTRRIDVLVLTSDLSYEPDIQDLITPIYIRYTRDAQSSGNPYCLWAFNYYDSGTMSTMIGALSKGGENLASTIPDNEELWLDAGESTPWIGINPYIVQSSLEGVKDKNRLQFIATRNSSTVDLITEQLEGTLEFAQGANKTLISSQTVTIDQDGPRFWVVVPGNISLYPTLIKTSWEFLDVSQDVVDLYMETPAAPAIKYINVCAVLGLDIDIDDTDLFEAEVDMLLDMGMNNLIDNGANVNKTTLGLLSGSGITTSPMLFAEKIDGCYSNPDTDDIESTLDDQETEWTGQTTNVIRVKVGDEFKPNSIEHVTSCSTCSNSFNTYVQTLGFSLTDFGITSWAQAVPKGHIDRNTYPLLYYYTHIFRFDRFRAMGNICQDEISSRFANGLAFMNFPHLGIYMNTWVTAGGGQDIFITMRDTATEDSLGMGWSEDWEYWGAGPMMSSCLWSIMRTACKPDNKPFGGHIILRDTIYQNFRAKLYEALSNGMTVFSLYNYGPSYRTRDDWSDRTYIYPTVMEVLAEFGRVDAYLNGATRQQADVAVLYNRTAGIWEAHDATENAWELDAQYTFWALRHAGYNVDIIPEEDIADGALSNYKVLYINGVNIHEDAADAISTWLGSGSDKVLVGSAGAGRKNEKNQSITTLDTLFGVSSASLTRASTVGIGGIRPLFEAKTLTTEVEATVTLPSSTDIDVLCWQETITQAAGTVTIAEDENDKVIGITKSVGDNTSIRYGFLPALTYLHEAWDSTASYHTGTATGFDTDIRNVICYGANLGAEKIATANKPLMELTRWDKSGYSLIFLINHEFPDTTQSVTITVPDCGSTTNVYSAVQNSNLTYTQNGDDISLTFNMSRNTDVLIIAHYKCSNYSTLIMVL